MNKALKTDIRELIFIRDLQPEEQRGSAAGLADAIIALLQPRLLTKDEANYIQSHLKSNSSCRPWKCGFYDCRRIKDLVLAKLKRIQEAK